METCVARKSKTGREGGELGAKRVVHISLRVADEGGIRDAEGVGERARKQLNRWGWDIYDVTLETEPRIGAVPDQCWNMTIS